MNGKKWIIVFISIIIILAIITAIIVVIFDPFFHYHKPLFNYVLNSERYINDGILRQFDYDAMIVGTSFTQNFKTSEFDELFECNSIKVPLPGGQFKEIGDQMKRAVKYNEHIKAILYGVVYTDILSDKDSSAYEGIPTYLYDDNIYNDIQYLLSGYALKQTAKDVLATIRGESDTFDKYSNWNDEFDYSKESVFKYYVREEATAEPITGLSNEEKEMVKGNVEQNIADIINDNKDITFYIYISPNSIVWWDDMKQKGEIQKKLEAEEIFLNTLLEYDNVKLYSFLNNFELVCDLSNYRDVVHYKEDINSQILKWIKNDEYLITKENVQEYMEQEREFYLNYDYDGIFEDFE